jgi:very-short-patch-repair endonuclease/DNA-directed RNA polymerase subunit RPC12/RpoP
MYRETLKKRLEKSGFKLTDKKDKILSDDCLEFVAKACKHKFNMYPKNLYRKINKGDKFCPNCSIKKRTQKRSLATKDVANAIENITQKEYKLIGKYISQAVNTTILHKTCGKKFDMRLDNFIGQGKRCPYCASKTQESKTAQLLKRLLENLDIKFIEEYTFNDCRNPFTNNKLRFDIFIPEKKLLIEIDGEQHYIPVERFGGEKGLKDTKYRDYIKNKYAFENQIDLIRISLYDVSKCKKKSYEEMKIEIFYLIKELTEEV